MWLHCSHLRTTTCYVAPSNVKSREKPVQLKAAVWTRATGAGKSEGTWASAIPDTLASVANPVELIDGIVDSNA